MHSLCNLSTQSALEIGLVNVKCWFKWQKGYAMTFGLIGVDRQGGQKRTAKPSLACPGSWRK